MMQMIVCVSLGLNPTGLDTSAILTEMSQSVSESETGRLIFQPFRDLVDYLTVTADCQINTLPVH
jgi:hypothetical protein